MTAAASQTRRRHPLPPPLRPLLQTATSAGAAPAWLPGLVLTFALTIPAWATFVRPDFSLWRLLDGDGHLHRLVLIQQAIAGGDWYPRWLPQHYGGYGYPTLNFYAPSFYYVTLGLAVVLRPLGLYGAVQAVGALAALALLAGIYALGWRLWRHGPAALLAAAAAAYAPYVLQANLFVRGALPEIMGLALVVWLLTACLGLWQATVADEERRTSDGWAFVLRPSSFVIRPDCSPGVWRWWWGVVGLTAALLLTHNLAAALGAVLVLGWLAGLWLWRPSPRALLVLAGAAALGAALAAFFWLPALLEASAVQLDRMHRGILHYRNWFLRWPGNHPEEWGMPARSPWTPGFPFDLHLLYPYALYGPPKASIWQAPLLAASAVTLAVAALRIVVGVVRARAGRPHLRAPSPRGGEGERWSTGGPPASPSPIVGEGPGVRGTDRRVALLSVSFGLGVAVVCYAQSFDWALPGWERHASLRSIQFPWRLLGPADLGVALAAGGALALWLRPGRAAWLAAGLATTALAIAGTGNRPAHTAPDVSRTVDLSYVLGMQQNRPDYTASTFEFLPRTADYATWHEGEARGFWLYERLFPEAAWLGGRLLVWEGPAPVRALAGGPLWAAADVLVEAAPPAAAGAGAPGAAPGAVLAFHQLAFPGWRAWVDGRPAPVGVTPPLPDQAIQPGFVLVAVPPGEHRVAVRFGPSDPHLAGAAVSLAAWAALGLWLLGQGRWGRREAGLPPRAADVTPSRGSAPCPQGIPPPLRRGDGERGWQDRGSPRPPPPAAGVRGADRAGGGLGVRSAAGALVLLGAALAGARLLLPLRPPAPAGGRAADRVVLAALADSVLAGRAAATSPSGSALGPDKFVDVRSLPLRAQDRPLRDAGARPRRWLYMHPPAEVAVDVALPPVSPGGAGLYLQAALALDPAAWSAPTGDGVRFAAAVAPAGGAETIVLDAALNPRARGEQRRWVEVLADLSPWGGRTVRLVLRTEPRADPTYDWAGWGEPAVVRLDALTAARLRSSAAAIQDLALRP